MAAFSRMRFEEHSKRNPGAAVDWAGWFIYPDPMLRSLLAKLSAPEPEPLDKEDCRLALAVLLVRIGRSDGDYAPAERDRIDCVLRSRYGIGQGDAEELRAQAEDIETDAPDTVRFTRNLKDVVPFEEREALIEALWDVALSDGRHADEEHGHMRLISSLLGISDRDSALARRRIAARSE